MKGTAKRMGKTARRRYEANKVDAGFGADFFAHDMLLQLPMQRLLCELGEEGNIKQRTADPNSVPAVVTKKKNFPKCEHGRVCETPVKMQVKNPPKIVFYTLDVVQQLRPTYRSIEENISIGSCEYTCQFICFYNGHSHFICFGFFDFRWVMYNSILTEVGTRPIKMKDVEGKKYKTPYEYYEAKFKVNDAFSPAYMMYVKSEE